MIFRNMKTRFSKFALPACLLVFVGACSSGGSDVAPCIPDQVLPPGSTSSLAFVAERAPRFGSGRIERINITGCDAVDGQYPATGSDIVVVTDGTDIYELGRSNLQSVTKFSAADTDTPIYQYSVAASGGNPYQIVFVSETKAYMIDYDSSNVSIIDPSATSIDSFITGTLDLSAYDTADNLPEPNGAVLVGNKLFIQMERLERPAYEVNREGYVAVFDTNTDMEIDTGMGTQDGLKGIPLGVRNPAKLQYSETDDLLFLIGRGSNFSDAAEGVNRFTGGVASIDPSTYSTELLFDDGDETDSNTDVSRGFVSSLLATGAGQAYLVTQQSFGNSTLYNLNTLTGSLGSTAVAGLENVDITTLAEDNQSRLWVGLNGDTPGFQLRDITTGSDLGTFIETQLVPINVVFLDTIVPEPTL